MSPPSSFSSGSGLGAVSAQAGAAALAAATAALTSATDASDTLAATAPVAGLKTSWLRPLSDGESWPLMKWSMCGRLISFPLVLSMSDEGAVSCAFLRCVDQVGVGMEQQE
jgi:hypothetical protein